MAKREIHKFVDCEDNFTAEIYCEYDDETREVLEETVIFSNSEVDYSSESIESINNRDREAKENILKKLPTQFKQKEDDREESGG